ncbi:MAG: FlxA-like family protein [Aquificaceae bacterium]|nr:FlxA-like family protein [Aquificaceae bacterium]
MRKVLLVTAILSGNVFAQPMDERIRQLEEQIRVLQQEVQRLREEQRKAEETKKETEVLKEEIRKLRLEIAMPQIEIKSYSGLGPAASKVHFNPKGVSIGGYGELLFRHNDVDARGGAKNIANMQRLILYLGYAFNEKLKFNSELELEHASTSGEHGTGGGYFKSELAYLDYQFRPEFGLRGGLLLMPVGIVNEVHEPPTFPSAERPFFERRIAMSTWEEMGFGVYGTVGPVDYRFYVTNGLMLRGGGGYNVLEPLKTARQRGARAVMDRLGFTGRIDVNLPLNLTLGGSFWTGDIQSKGGSDSGLNLRRGTKVGSVTMLLPHLWWQHAGWDVRFVGAYVKVEDALRVSQDLFGNNLQNPNTGTNRNNIMPREQKGYYLQIAYDMFRLFGPDNQELYVFGIYEDFDTHSKVPQGYLKPNGNKLKVYNLGISYKPHPLVAIKVDYAKLDYSRPRRDEKEYRLTLGFMF